MNACAEDGGGPTGTGQSAITLIGVELCANSIDDDLDGATDENPCRITTSGSPASGDGVVPQEWTDNPDCGDLGLGYGFKIDGVPSGTYYFTTADGVLTGGAPEDPTNFVTVTPANPYFDWSASLGIDAVIVKGGSVGANVYVYSPEDLADADLATTGANYGISHVEFCYDYELAVSKTASTEWYRTYTWTIDKSVTPSSLHMFIGNSGSFGYTVAVDRTVTDSGWKISGDITVHNPTPYAVSFSVSDVIDGGVGAATVSCPAYSVAAGGTVVCSYEATPGAELGTLNTAVVTSSTAGVGGDTATASVVWGDPIAVGYSSINVSDTNGESWTASGDASWSYSVPKSCSADPSVYTAGTYSYTHDNTAKIEETGQSDSETVTVHCYAPVVAKNAAASYTRTYTWSIDKTVAPGSHVGFPGDTFTSDYSVSVDQSVAESAFAVAGSITIANPHPSAAMLISIQDVVDGVPAVVDCGGASSVPAASTLTCSYAASLPAKADGTNVATVTFNSIDFPATASYAFGEPTTVEGYASVLVTDTREDTTELGTATGDTTWPYSVDFQCPTDPGAYTAGVYTKSVPNTAKIEETGQSDSENVDVTCYLPAKAKVVKLTQEGPEDIGQFPFTFQLKNPSGTVVETASLNAAGEVVFAEPIITEGTWTVLESVPAGWVASSTECTFTVDFPSSAGATYTCTFENIEKGRVNVLKLTQGAVDSTRSWTFKLFEGPDGHGGTLLGSANTLGDSDGILEQLGGDLDPADTYTLCEESVPAGWSTVWMVDTDGDGVADTIVIPYNPNADDDPPADVGHRCFDFGAGTDYAVPVGDTLVFQIDNQYPGGEPRTPGYWKNWNTCTGGGQAATAAANGGWEEGFWLLDDVLNDPGITWDDILADLFVFPITSCEQAVAILDSRDFVSGKKMSADAAYTLARALLAAQLNAAAGAEWCDAIGDAVLDAEELLDYYDFDGSDIYLRKGEPYAYALELAEIIDSYNNGLLCTP